MPEYYLFIPAKPRRSGGRLTADLAQVLPEQVPAPTEEGIVPEGEREMLQRDEHGTFSGLIVGSFRHTLYIMSVTKKGEKFSKRLMSLGVLCRNKLTHYSGI